MAGVNAAQIALGAASRCQRDPRREERAGRSPGSQPAWCSGALFALLPLAGEIIIFPKTPQLPIHNFGLSAGHPPPPSPLSSPPSPSGGGPIGPITRAANQPPAPARNRLALEHSGEDQGEGWREHEDTGSGEGWRECEDAGSGEAWREQRGGSGEGWRKRREDQEKDGGSMWTQDQEKDGGSTRTQDQEKDGGSVRTQDQDGGSARTQGGSGEGWREREDTGSGEGWREQRGDQGEGWREHREDKGEGWRERDYTGSGWREHEDTRSGEGWREGEDTVRIRRRMEGAQGRTREKDGGNVWTKGGSGRGLLQRQEVISAEPDGPWRSTV